MSEKTKEGTLHIKIGHLDALLRQAEEALSRVARRDYEQAAPAMLSMRYLLASMEPTDRAQLAEVEKYITEEWAALSRSRSLTLRNRRIDMRFDIYVGWLKEIQDALWRFGYWSNEKYGFHDPSGGKKS